MPTAGSRPACTSAHRSRRESTRDGLFIVPGCRVAEQHRAEVADLQGHRLGEAAEEGDLLGPQPPGGPARDLARGREVTGPQELHHLPVGVAPHPDHPVAGLGQRAEHLDRLRAGRDVSGDHDPVGGADIGLGEHGLQCGGTPWMSESTATVAYAMASACRGVPSADHGFHVRRTASSGRPPWPPAAAHLAQRPALRAPCPHVASPGASGRAGHPEPVVTVPAGHAIRAR